MPDIPAMVWPTVIEPEPVGKTQQAQPLCS
jgi:hypothetical protein